MALKELASPFQFKPFSPKQKQLLTWWMPQSPYHDYDMIIADGAIRSGKTIAMSDGFLTWASATHHDQTLIMAGKTVDTFKRNVIAPMVQILTAKGIRYQHRRGDHCLEVGSNKLYYFGANNEASQDVIQGLTGAGGLVDEMALMPESFVKQLMGRCSVPGSKIWGNCNPGSPFHYVKTELIDQSVEKKILHLHFTMTDNWTLTPERRAFYERMYSGLWYKRYVLGLWVAAEGAIYDMWTDEHIVDTLPVLHRVSVGIDYGTANPTVFLLAGEDEYGNLYIAKEYYYSSKAKGRQKTDAEYSKDLIEFIRGQAPMAIVYDPSAASFGVQMRQDRIIQLRTANNSVLDGIRITSSWLQKKKLFVHSSCVNTIREIQSYVWDPKAEEHGEDAPVKFDDHCCDALRYIMATLYKRR